MKKLLLLLLIVLAVPVTIMADDPVEIDGIYYNLITKAKIAKVTRNPNGYSGDIVIPSTVTYNSVDYDVKEIEGSAFSGYSGLTSIDILDGVTSIGNRAFEGCSSLTSVSIPNTVTIIEPWAFINCSGLTSIDIPNSVTSIGMSAFSGCTGLTSITIPSSVTSIDGSVFAGCSSITSISVDSENTVYNSLNNCNAIIETSSNTLIIGCKNTIIPSSVTSIGGNAFSGCSGLTSIDIPDGVTSIGEGAFSNCSGLISFDIPENLTTIRSRTFENCSHLVSIIIPEGVTSIGGNAFSGCSDLTSIVLPNSLEDAGGLKGCYPTYLEYHCRLEKFVVNNRYYGPEITKIETLVIGDEIDLVGGTSIGYACFNYNNNLKNVTIGTGVTNIVNCFRNCENLEVVTCRSTTPPSVSNGPFDGSYIEYATLIVPDEAYTAYSNTEPWSNFGTILKASQISTVTANDYTREYGDTNPSEWEYTVVGQALDGTPNRICDADETSAPGEYPIVISQGTETNTNVTYVNGTLTVTKAPLTITANSYTIKEGDALPTFDAVFTGLKNNEPESVVNPVITPTATDSNTPGTYDINVTATSDNYDITIEAGTLTILPAKMSITIGAPGVGTYCSPYDLDFSTVTDFKAYIATGYNSATGNVIVQAVKDVPAGTGLFLKGTPGTYDVPCGESSSYYVNMLVGVTEATTISATDGNMTNFLLSATNTSDACFRPISSTYNLKANRAYLQIPTYMVGSSAGANAVGIEFEDGVTGIDNSLSDMDTDAHWFTLDGRRLNGKPTQKGIYVVNGQKVVIK